MTGFLMKSPLVEHAVSFYAVGYEAIPAEEEEANPALSPTIFDSSNSYVGDTYGPGVPATTGMGSGTSAGDSLVVKLGAPLPNPAGGSMRIGFSVARTGAVVVEMRDFGGSLVRVLVKGTVAAGNHSYVWDGRDGSGRQVPAGVYFCTLKVDGRKVGERRVVWLR